MTAIIEVVPWTGNAKEKSKKNHRFDAELPATSGVLLACPFCGGEARLEHTWTASYWIECVECNAQADGSWSGDASKPQDHRRAAQSAIDAWNRRVQL